MKIENIHIRMRVKIIIDPKKKQDYKDFNGLEGVVDSIDSIHDRDYPVSIWIEKDGERTGDCPGFKPEELEEVK